MTTLVAAVALVVAVTPLSVQHGPLDSQDSRLCESVCTKVAGLCPARTERLTLSNGNLQARWDHGVLAHGLCMNLPPRCSPECFVNCLSLPDELLYLQWRSVASFHLGAPVHAVLPLHLPCVQHFPAPAGFQEEEEADSMPQVEKIVALRPMLAEHGFLLAEEVSTLLLMFFQGWHHQCCCARFLHSSYPGKPCSMRCVGGSFEGLRLAWHLAELSQMNSWRQHSQGSLSLTNWQTMAVANDRPNF